MSVPNTTLFRSTGNVHVADSEGSTIKARQEALLATGSFLCGRRLPDASSSAANRSARQVTVNKAAASSRAVSTAAQNNGVVRPSAPAAQSNGAAAASEEPRITEEEYVSGQETKAITDTIGKLKAEINIEFDDIFKKKSLLVSLISVSKEKQISETFYIFRTEIEKQEKTINENKKLLEQDKNSCQRLLASAMTLLATKVLSDEKASLIPSLQRDAETLHKKAKAAPGVHAVFARARAARKPQK